MKTFTSIVAALLLTICGTSCKSYSFGHRDPNCNVDERLAGLLAAYDRAKQPGEHKKEYLVDCDRVRNSIERLALEFPTHVPTLMANAVLAHDALENTKSARYLDSLFSLEPVHADAAVLRSEIALDEGNLPGARRLVEAQISYAPDHARLREMHSLVLYLSRDLEGARAEIGAAEKLGAPAWRVAYHRGLIAESAGDVAEARRQLQTAVDANPEFKPARSRLTGIDAGTSYNAAQSPPGKDGGN